MEALRRKAVADDADFDGRRHDGYFGAGINSRDRRFEPVSVRNFIRPSMLYPSSSPFPSSASVAAELASRYSDKSRGVTGTAFPPGAPKCPCRSWGNHIGCWGSNLCRV